MTNQCLLARMSRLKSFDDKVGKEENIFLAARQH
jgi:hypothetical protein